MVSHFYHHWCSGNQRGLYFCNDHQKCREKILEIEEVKYESKKRYYSTRVAEGGGENQRGGGKEAEIKRGFNIFRLSSRR